MSNKKNSQSNQHKTYTDQCDDRVIQFLLNHENKPLTNDDIKHGIPGLDKRRINQTLYYLREHPTTLSTHVLRQTPCKKPTFILMTKGNDALDYLTSLTYQQLCKSTRSSLSVNDIFELVMQRDRMTEKPDHKRTQVNAFLDSIESKPQLFWNAIYPKLIDSLACSERLCFYGDGKISIEYDTARMILLIDSASYINILDDELTQKLIDFGWIICHINTTHIPGDDVHKEIVPCITQGQTQKRPQVISIHMPSFEKVNWSFVFGQLYIAFPLYEITLYTTSQPFMKKLNKIQRIPEMQKKLKVTSILKLPNHIKPNELGNQIEP